MLSSILRIIEGTQQGNVEKVVAYAKRILPKEELEDELMEKCIREKFNPNAARAVMEDCSVKMTLYEVLNALCFIEKQVTSTHFPTNITKIDSNISGDWKDWCIKFHTKEEVVDAEGKPVDSETLENVCKMVRKATKEQMIKRAVKYVHDYYDGYDGADVERDIRKYMEEV